jgi:hypothetical protein
MIKMFLKTSFTGVKRHPPAAKKEQSALLRH